MARLSRIHPYPAMIANELADDLCARFVKRNDRVLDPFCGTGRTLLASAEVGAHIVGIDINPLAIMLTRAKAGNPSPDKLRQVLEKIPQVRHHVKVRDAEIKDLEPGRSVDWFSLTCKKELCEIIQWLNRLRISEDEILLLASVLSATVREVSYCRQDQWKLHRLSANERRTFNKSAWSIFERRFRVILGELQSLPKLSGECKVILGDARLLKDTLTSHQVNDLFDVVITSPPYGDSRTTVSYGGISGICLGVLRQLRALQIPFLDSGAIDRLCLGGAITKSGLANFDKEIELRRYWCGGKFNSSRERVLQFLYDIENCCEQMSGVIRPEGKIIIVVARRTVSGHRVYLDKFLIDKMWELGYSLEAYNSRLIAGKNTPKVINKNGHGSGSLTNRGRVVTIKEEFVLVFRKTRFSYRQ